ncbi:MAG: hypothetical protein HY707_01255 [Ignavibacteriae bacterium]|nr:hypothetical protein [Ignavibacteriota bacterium]
MKRHLLFLIYCSLLALAQSKQPAEHFIPAFSLKPNSLELSRLAQPTQYFDKIGRRAGLMGYESGQFEMWVWPWKVLRNFELQFLLGSSTQPILAKDIVRTISVTPEVTTLTYTYESFTVKEHIFIPRKEPGAILLLDVHTTTPLSIIPGFIPVMQPMWPCGIGGQFSYWDDDANAYVISEGQWRAIFLCGSPAGQQMAAPPAHMFADNPLQFRIDVKPNETDGKFIPIVIAGAMPDTSNWKMKYDSVKTTYSRLWKDAEKYYVECYDYYQNLRTSTMQITTPDKEFNLAYEWGKVALDNLMIENPRLGYGMVAGFGLSGGGARPGFAWFFGGDAFINVLALNSVGMFQQSRDALAFTQKWQRQENFPIRKKNPSDLPRDVGKMAHELSQSDGLCDWWNDYHYGYNHADTSPWYLVAMADYVRTSGDTAFLRQSWKSVKQAYEWCISKDSDGDGLMDLKGAGLGALEFGKLVGIYADVYTCGVWVKAAKEMMLMAGLLNDEEVRSKAGLQYKRALGSFEKKFWMRDIGYYSYGITEKGEQVKEKTPWPATVVMLGALDDAGFSYKTSSLEFLNSSEISTDWGTRSLSPRSSLFDPTNYNYGAVWPFISTFVGMSQYRYHYPLSGYLTLQSVIRHVFDNGLGYVPEVFSGEMNQKLGEAYHHQGFSTTGYMVPFVRGLLGYEVNALENTVKLLPHLPANWDSVAIKNVPIGNNAYDFVIKQSDTALALKVHSLDSATCRVIFSPGLPPGTQVKGGKTNGRDNKTSTMASVQDGTATVLSDESQGFHPTTIEHVGSGDVLEINYEPTAAVLPPTLQTSPGAENFSLKVISQKLDEMDNKKVRLLVEGLSGKSYQLGVVRAQFVSLVQGAELLDDQLKISFDKKPKQEFVRKEIVIQLK